MIDLQQHKENNLNKISQVLLLDFSGLVVQSCDSIFDTHNYRRKSIKDDIPFLESIFDVIKSHVIGSPEILFSKIESPSKILQGFYDFTFCKLIIDNQSFILWKIYDFTRLYKDLINYQQRHNETEIKRQLEEEALHFENQLIQPFDFANSVKSVIEAFGYQSHVTIQEIESNVKNTLHGDITKFKFMLYNLLNNITSIYKKVKIQLNIVNNSLVDNTYFNLKFTIKGKALNLSLFKNFINNNYLNSNNLSAEEQLVLSKLYQIQDIVKQQKGYFEIKIADQAIQQLQSILIFNFQFKILQIQNS